MPACDLNAWSLDYGFPAQGYEATIDNQTTPLMKASHLGDAAIANLLIQRGVSVNARNSDGNNALWFAWISADLAVLGLLVDAGINLDNRNHNQATCLMYAASTGKAEVLSKLTHAGAELHHETLDAFSALDMAATIDCLTLLRRAVNALLPAPPGVAVRQPS